MIRPFRSSCIYESLIHVKHEYEFVFLWFLFYVFRNDKEILLWGCGCLVKIVFQLHYLKMYSRQEDKLENELVLQLSYNFLSNYSFTSIYHCVFYEHYSICIKFISSHILRVINLNKQKEIVSKQIYLYFVNLNLK